MPKRNHLEEDDSDDDNPSLVNVDFDFFDICPVDFIAIKRMLAQLFQSDSELVKIHELADLVTSQNLPGTTVKTDGIEGDPYAFLTIINLNVDQNNPAIGALVDYLLAKCDDDPSLSQMLRSLLNPSAGSHTALILSERLINMPIQVVPPMYRMLQDEIKLAIEKNEPCLFSHYLMISRTYKLWQEDDSLTVGIEQSEPPAKRPRATGSKQSASAIYSYHHEDQVWEELSVACHHFKHAQGESKETDTFRAEVGGKVTLLSAEHFTTLVEAILQRYSAV